MKRQAVQRAFTLVELAVVVAVLGVSMALGVGGIVNTVAVHRQNAALAEANLALREERSRALETRRPRFVRPDPTGNGLLIGSATTTTTGTGASATTTCTDGPVEQRLDLGPIKATGDRVCFTEDGNTDADAPLTLGFVASTSTSPIEVKIFPAGTLRWTGASLFLSSKAVVPSISVHNIAAQTFNPIYLQ
jgi:prepilin-type N-terminal cleavage/methylation domain-containing protein